MRLEVTRDVVSDLWALCTSGEASPDTRTLVDAFLAGDPPFAETLRRSDSLPGLVPRLSLTPDAERRLLDQARQHARNKLLLIGGAIAVAGFVALLSLAGALVFLASRH
jgi:hypothetical protein